MALTKITNDMIEGRDYVVCKVCGKKFRSVALHVTKHNLTVKEYKDMFCIPYNKTGTIEAETLTKRRSSLANERLETNKNFGEAHKYVDQCRVANRGSRKHYSAFYQQMQKDKAKKLNYEVNPTRFDQHHSEMKKELKKEYKKFKQSDFETFHSYCMKKNKMNIYDYWRTLKKHKKCTKELKND